MGILRTIRDIIAAPRRVRELENKVTSMEAESWASLGNLVGRLIAEVQSLRDGITTKQAALTEALAALQGKDEEAVRKVQAALDADSDADVVRIGGLVDQISAALPVDVPTVPVPPIGEPAQDPGENTNPGQNPGPSGDQPGTEIPGQNSDGTPAPQPGTEDAPPTEGAATPGAAGGNV